MDEAGQGIVLCSPPNCGVPVARVGLFDRSVERSPCASVGSTDARKTEVFPQDRIHDPTASGMLGRPAKSFVSRAFTARHYLGTVAIIEFT
jgi:hypothetical protein